MKSLFFICLMNGAPWGGSEEIWYRSALYAATKGHRVACALFYWEEKKDKIEKLENAGIKIFLLPNTGRRKQTLLQKLRYEWVTKLQLSRFITKLTVADYDIVIVNQGGFTEVCHAPWKAFYNKLRKYALVFHNYHEQTSLPAKKKNILRNWMQRASINLFDAERIKTVLGNYLAIPVDNGTVLYNPITFDPPNIFTPLPEKSNGNYVLVMLAALDVSRKAQDNLVKTLSSSKWMNREWVLHIYGDGKDRELMESLIAEKHLGHKVFLQGHTSQPQMVLQQAHLLLQVTHMDAMPISVVEAMAMSRPVVVSKIGDMPQWVSEGENGWIAEDASEKNIDLALEKAWQQRDNWSLAGENAFKVFNRKYPSSPETYFLNKILSATE